MRVLLVRLKISIEYFVSTNHTSFELKELLDMPKQDLSVDGRGLENFKRVSKMQGRELSKVPKVIQER